MLLSGFLLPLTVTYYTMIFISQVLVKCLTNEKIEIVKRLSEILLRRCHKYLHKSKLFKNADYTFKNKNLENNPVIFFI